MNHVRALIIFLCLQLMSLSGAVAQQIRPFSGCGVVIVRPLNPERPADMAPIPFFRDPGVARITESPIGEIPRLTSIVNTSAHEYPLAVMGKKGKWLLIAYDDAGREGWVEMARWWDYSTWDKFLKGSVARLLSGLKRNAYILRAEPAETAPQTGALAGTENLIIVEIADDWAQVVADSGLHGWLHWRDGDGRFQIVVDNGPAHKNVD